MKRITRFIWVIRNTGWMLLIKPEEPDTGKDCKKVFLKLITKFFNMREIELYKLLDLIEEIKKLEELIKLHKSSDDSDFMVSQYEAKKIKLTSELIDELVSPEIQSAQSFSLIHRIIDKFYPSEDTNLINNDAAIQQLAASI